MGSQSQTWLSDFHFHFQLISSEVLQTGSVLSSYPPLPAVDESLFLFLNRRMTSLQYCIGFCHTSVWISHKHTYVASLLHLPPTISQVVTEHQVWAFCITQQIPTKYLKEYRQYDSILGPVWKFGIKKYTFPCYMDKENAFCSAKQ